MGAANCQEGPRDLRATHRSDYFIFQFSPKDIFIVLRERERDISVRENVSWLPLCTHPKWGSNPQPSYVP